MRKYTVRTYCENDFERWNAFIANARNATFLFDRNFMEYHKDRFRDFSLVVEDGADWVAVLPANIAGNEVFSHQGLTYGGLVYDKNLDVIALDAILDEMIVFLKENGCKRLVYKPIILIYTGFVPEPVGAMLLQRNAELFRKDKNLAIDFSKELQISKSKLKHFRRISGLDIEMRQETSFDAFWDEVLEPRLRDRHQVKPVHSKDEITYLAAKFPKNILQFNAYFEEELVAGITLFHFGNGVKSQYGATTEAGQKIRALDFLFISLIEKYKTEVTFFDMGTVTEDNELGYNPGLLQQKQELGCSVFDQDFYSIAL